MTTATSETDGAVVAEWESEFPPEMLTLIRAHLDELLPIPSDSSLAPEKVELGLGIHLGSMWLLAAQGDVENLRVLAVPVDGGDFVDEALGFYLLRMDGHHLVLRPERKIDLGHGPRLVGFPVIELRPCFRDKSGLSRQRRNRHGPKSKPLPALRFTDEKVSFAMPSGRAGRSARGSLIQQVPPELGSLLVGKLN